MFHLSYIWAKHINFILFQFSTKGLGVARLELEPKQYNGELKVPNDESE